MRDEATAYVFVDRLKAAPALFGGRPAISPGIDHEVQLIAESGLAAPATS